MMIGHNMPTPHEADVPPGLGASRGSDPPRGKASGSSSKNAVKSYTNEILRI